MPGNESSSPPVSFKSAPTAEAPPPDIARHPVGGANHSVGGGAEPGVGPLPESPSATDAPGIISMILGIVSLVVMVFGFFFSCVGGFILYPFALLLALGGLILAFFGRGGLKVTGLTLNTLVFVPSLILLGIMFVAAVGLGTASVASGPAGSRVAPNRPVRGMPSDSRNRSSGAPATGDGAGKTTGTGSAPEDSAEEAAAAAEAERERLEELTRQRGVLLTELRSRSNWLVSLNVQGERPLKLRLRLAHQQNDGEHVVVVLEEWNNTAARGVWGGALVPPPAPERSRPGFSQPVNPPGWTIRLVPGEGQPKFPAFCREIVLGAGGEGWLQWLNLTSPLALARDADASPLLDVAELRARLESSTAPGQVWEGLYRPADAKSEPMFLTFTERRDGGYVRAVLESKENPWSVSIWEGETLTAPDALYGQAVRFRRHGPAGTDDGFHKRETLMLGWDGTADETWRAESLELRRGEPIKSFQANRTQWSTALQPGARWTGELRYDGEPPMHIAMTVAEVRDELSYVRLLVEDQELRTRCRVLEGSLDRGDSMVDGYALTVQGMLPATQPTRGRGYSSYTDLFGIHKEAQRFRLAPDGKTLYCLTKAGERVLLTRSDTSSVLPLETQAAEAHWRKLLASGARWSGKLLHWGRNGELIPTDVELVVTNGVDANGKLGVAMRVPDIPKVVIRFDGLLRLTQPEYSNAFALDLSKVNKGVDSDSATFGRHVNNHLHFRLATDGRTLIGYSDGIGGVMPPYQETMELKPDHGADRSK